MKLNQVNLGSNNTKATKLNNIRRNINFKGMASAIGDANKSLMHSIENGGFFAEFVIMDLCGLVLPRVWQGFNRNKKELGHWNIQAGTEELLREGITGPSMFLIPIAAVILAGRSLGKGTRINSQLLKEFSNSFKKLGTELVNSDLVKKQKDFAGKIFDDIFVNNPNKKLPNGPYSLKSLNEFKNDFVAQLTDSLNTKLSKNDSKAKVGKFNELISEINASYFHYDNTTAVKIKNANNEISTSATDLYKDARKYLEDIVASTDATLNESKASGKVVNTNFVNDAIDKITKIRENGRKLLCIGGTASLAAFLSIIPKIYQISKNNPALNGIATPDNKKGGINA